MKPGEEIFSGIRFSYLLVSTHFAHRYGASRCVRNQWLEHISACSSLADGRFYQKRKGAVILYALDLVDTVVFLQINMDQLELLLGLLGQAQKGIGLDLTTAKSYLPSFKIFDTVDTQVFWNI